MTRFRRLLRAVLPVLLLAGACTTPLSGAESEGRGQQVAPSEQAAGGGGQVPATPPGTATTSPRGAATSPASPPSDASPPCADPLGCFGEPRRIGTFDVEAVPEASGLAASMLNPQVLYLLDDSPGTDGILAVLRDGTTLGALPVAGMDARDGESLASGPCQRDGPPCLYIGDIGDNARSRDDVAVSRVVEPDLTQDQPLPLRADTARLRYPDGPHDAEALLVDEAGRVHIVTKAPFDREAGTTGETRLYRADAFADGVLTDLGPLPVPEPSFPVHSMFVGNVVTGGEHRDGRVLLRTYDQVLEYVAPDGQRDLSTLATWEVREAPSPPERQSEAITWAGDGCGYLTVGEAVGDIWEVPCRP